MWRFMPSSSAAAENVRIEPFLTSNDGGTVRDWAIAGLGIIARSEWDVAEHLQAGRLVPLLKEWKLPDADIVALISSRHDRSLRVARFLDHLHTVVSQLPWLQPAIAEPSESGAASRRNRKLG
jgi:DNA-binding transcriptional LysR family regulator